jgi:hypothetical protein
VDSEPFLCSTNQYHQIYLATHCLPSIKLPELASSPLEFLQSIRRLKVGKAPGPNGIPNRVLRHRPKREITFLTKKFDAELRRQHLPPAWKHARVVDDLCKHIIFASYDDSNLKIAVMMSEILLLSHI